MELLDCYLSSCMPSTEVKAGCGYLTTKNGCRVETVSLTFSVPKVVVLGKSKCSEYSEQNLG